MEAQLEISNKNLNELIKVPNNASLEEIQNILDAMEQNNVCKKKIS